MAYKILNIFTKYLLICTILNNFGFTLCKSRFDNKNDAEGIYMIGAGIGDITGVGETRLAGYVNPITFTGGIHIRMFSRAFIVQSIDSGDRVVFVSTDMAFFDQALKQEIIKKLETKFGNTYSTKNVLISTTHTHSASGGFVQYFAYAVESFGFSPKNFEIIRDGVVDSITKAHESMVQGRIYKNSGRVENASGNRSGGAYNNNPQEERDQYPDNVDKDMTLLRLEDLNGNPIGCINWFAVHPISVNGAMNPLISGDNKGYASILLENHMNPDDRPGFGKFVASFASSNLGDVSPQHNPIEGNEEKVVYPGLEEEFRNVKINGERQYIKALELFNDKEGSTLLTGPIQYAHQYINMSTYIPVVVKNPDTGEDEIKTSCPGAAGYEFVGIPVEFGPIWDMIRDLVKKPSEKMLECQLPKPVAIPVGEMYEPFEWGANIVDTQVLRMGSLEIIGVPGEFTTMSGRRMRNAINAISGHESVIAGVSNVYTHYIATPEEYDLQDYEGASTFYGKYTLNVYIQQYSNLVRDMMADIEIPDGPSPPNYVADGILLSPNQPKVDQLARGQTYGQVIREPFPLALTGDKILAVFISGSLRHSSNREGTYFVIERLIDENNDLWEVVRTDSDLDAIIYWKKPYLNRQQSRVEISWEIPNSAETGTYRVRHFGHYLTEEGGISTPYIGQSKNFRIRATL